jgi:ribosomal protein S27E
MKIRYLINVLTGTKRTMLNAGAREEKCPHCGYLTPVYYHPGYKAASSCLWCGKEICEYSCQLCGKPYQKDEIPCADFSRGIYGGAHKVCLENMQAGGRSRLK